MRRHRQAPGSGRQGHLGEALSLACRLSAVSVANAGAGANWLAAGCWPFTFFFYALVYHHWLKRSTPWNIVIGAPPAPFPDDRLVAATDRSA